MFPLSHMIHSDTLSPEPRAQPFNNQLEQRIKTTTIIINYRMRYCDKTTTATNRTCVMPMSATVVTTLFSMIRQRHIAKSGSIMTIVATGWKYF